MYSSQKTISTKKLLETFHGFSFKYISKPKTQARVILRLNV